MEVYMDGSNIKIGNYRQPKIQELFDSNFPEGSASIGAISRRLSYLMFNLADIVREKCICYCWASEIDEEFHIDFLSDNHFLCRISLPISKPEQADRYIQYLLTEERKKWFNKREVVTSHLKFNTNKGKFDYYLNFDHTNKTYTRFLLTIIPDSPDVSRTVTGWIKSLLGCKSETVEVEDFDIVSYEVENMNEEQTNIKDH